MSGWGAAADHGNVLREQLRAEESTRTWIFQLHHEEELGNETSHLSAKRAALKIKTRVDLKGIMMMRMMMRMMMMRGITWLVPCGGRRLDTRQERDTAPLEQCHTHKTKTGIWMLTKISNKEIWLNKISSHIILYYILLLLSRKLYVHKNTNTQFCRTVWF